PTVADNPLDVGGMWRKGQIQPLAAAVIPHGDTDVVAFRLNLPDEPEEPLLDAYRCLAAASLQAGKLPLALSRASERLAERWYDFFADAGIPFLSEYERSLRAIGRLVDYNNLPMAAPTQAWPEVDVSWFRALTSGPLTYA